MRCIASSLHLLALIGLVGVLCHADEPEEPRTVAKRRTPPPANEPQSKEGEVSESEAAKEGAAPERENLVRRFCLPHPLFDASSTWRERIAKAPCKADDQRYIRQTYELLKSTTCRRAEGQNFLWLTFDEFAIPIFAGRWDDAASEEFLIQTYEDKSWEPSTMPSTRRDDRFYVKGAPRLAGAIRPAGPEGLDADGHLVLYDSTDEREYDFWHATTALDDTGSTKGGGHAGDKILWAGSVETFSIKGLGAQEPDPRCRPLTSSRATGVPLLAGLLVPEDFKEGASSTIQHALVFSLPKLRHLCPGDNGDGEIPRDYVYPATKTEMSQPLVKRFALAAGERIRLKPKGCQLWREDGGKFDENELALVTEKYLDALRQYGAYLADGADGFTFYAEDYRTANLELPPVEFNALMGRDASTPLPTRETQWQALMGQLQDDLYPLALAVETDDGFESNFEVVEDAKPPADFPAPPCSAEQINGCQ